VAERLVPGLRYTPEVVDGIADFVAEFSLAGVRAVAGANGANPQVQGSLATK